MRVVLNESDTYCEFAPPPWARGAIACFWVRQGDGSSVRVLPDACTDVVWRAGSGAVVAGPDSQAWASPTSPGELILGARLLPGAGGAALGVPLAEVRNRRVPVDALGLATPGELSDAVGPDTAAAALARLTLRLVAAAPPDPAVRAAVVRLLDPAQRVDELAESLGFSERQLRRRFLTAVGYSPKTLQRVLRLRRFLAATGAGMAGSPDQWWRGRPAEGWRSRPAEGWRGRPAERWRGRPAERWRGRPDRSSSGGPGRFDAGWDGLAGAAAGAGYADQAHLTRECRALTGLTPGQLAGSGR
jgi:AraC-like DNA-binding protein